jgi:penicillin-binding protein 1C
LRRRAVSLGAGAVVVAAVLLNVPAVLPAARLSNDATLRSSVAASSMPSFGQVRDAWTPSDIRILDRQGEILHETRVDPAVRRLAWTRLDEISPALVRAVLESEDRRFQSHGGLDWRAAAAAAWQRLRGGPPRGASTVTMQLAALIDPSLRRGSGPRGIGAKWKQVRAAFALEATWTKDEILEAYLNLVGFRGEVEGVRAASETVFGKAPHGLTTGESAALAASVRSPGASAATLLRRSQELAVRLGTKDGVDAAAMRLAGPAAERGSRRAIVPHAARLLLRDAHGHDVESSIDARIQELAASALARHVLDIRDRSASDGAVLVVDNETGEVLAYVGSTGELSSAAEVDGVRAPRQAGSTLKPFLYALAIDQAFLTPATLLEDAPLEIRVGDTVYRPENYDHRFRGLVPVRSALAASLNIPAVRVLTLVGEERFAETLRALHVSGVKESGDWYGPSLALGSVDVTLWDLVGAYRALARGGTWSALSLRRGERGRAEASASFVSSDSPASFASIASAARSAAPRAAERIFDASTSWIVGDMLADRGSRSATFELDGPLSTHFWTAVKTGTSKDMRDNWCIGWSSRYTVGVWIGNFSGEPMRDVSGTTGAAPVWREVMDALHAGVAGEPPSVPRDVASAWTVFAGKAAPPRHEWYREGTEPHAAGLDLDSHPRIVSPSAGSVLSIDPDMPPARQRVALVARAAEGMSWRLRAVVPGGAGSKVVAGVQVPGKASSLVRPDAQAPGGADSSEAPGSAECPVTRGEHTLGSAESPVTRGEHTLGSADSPLLWEPRAGSYELVLADREGRQVDSVRFRVNGGVGKRL